MWPSGPSVRRKIDAAAGSFESRLHAAAADVALTVDRFRDDAGSAPKIEGETIPIHSEDGERLTAAGGVVL